MATAMLNWSASNWSDFCSPSQDAAAVTVWFISCFHALRQYFTVWITPYVFLIFLLCVFMFLCFINIFCSEDKTKHLTSGFVFDLQYTSTYQLITQRWIFSKASIFNSIRNTPLLFSSPSILTVFGIVILLMDWWGKAYNWWLKLWLKV